MEVPKVEYKSTLEDIRSEKLKYLQDNMLSD